MLKLSLLFIFVRLVSAKSSSNAFTSLFVTSSRVSIQKKNIRYHQKSFRNIRGGGISQPRFLTFNATSSDCGSMSITELWDLLESSTDGLTSDQVKLRQEQYGFNILEKSKGKSTLTLILEQFEDRLVQILLGVALLSGIFSYLEVRQATGEEALWKSFVEPLIILAILVLNAAVGVWQTSSAQDSLEALQKLQPSLATVLRDGAWQSGIPASDLVPGDILEVRVGDKVPADARLVQLLTSSLQIDEGSLTGESVTVSKFSGDEGTVLPNLPLQDQRGMLYGGTMITSGSGRAVVVQTGMDTQMGKIQKGVTQAKADQSKTPLAIKLDEFGDTLTKIIGVICVAVWIISIPKMNDPSFSNGWEGAIYYAKVAVALGVAAIPEGLPAVITLCLSLGTRRMAQRNVIVRKLQSVETLGCTSVICTDKTGTLTTNEMTAVSLVLLEKSGKGILCKEYKVDGVSYAPSGTIESVIKDAEVKAIPKGALTDIAAVSALCNDASIIGSDVDYTFEEALLDEKGKVVGHIQSDVYKKSHKKQKVDLDKAFERVGEPTEAALCVLAEKIGGMAHFLDEVVIDSRTGLHINVPPSVLANANVKEWRYSKPRRATLEFNRDRKSMSVLCDWEKGKNRLFVKGAPNLLIERCTHVKTRDGSEVPLTGALRRQINSMVSSLAQRPLRCLALAIKDYRKLDASLKTFNPVEEGDASKHPLLKNPAKYKDIESGLTLVGIVGIKDPARPEVAESIKLCSKAGIRVIMITGDARDTAVAIARDVNILPPKDESENIKAFEGREFFLKPEEEQLQLLRGDNIVFCRAEPADKQKLVKMLQSLKEIPAMTGDGVNDAPALQQAAIGVAMGVTGTEVAKEAADMILADDNFSTIVAAVEEGRRIYANMQAFICFLISCNIGEICAILIATIGGFPEPLTAMHLLWVNLVTDGPPATALGFNPPAPDLMSQRPRPSDEPIMTRWMAIRYCITGLYVGLATVGIFVGHYLREGISLSQLSTWSKCGAAWMPVGGAELCPQLFEGLGRQTPQTLSLTALVVMEMLKALSAVSVDNSLLRVSPLSNPWLIFGVLIPSMLHLIVMYSGTFGFPALSESFGMSPLTLSQWAIVWSWALPVLLVEEILKGIGRYLNAKEQKRVS
jgi:P-type Ca2+ transporter type 2C